MGTCRGNTMNKSYWYLNNSGYTKGIACLSQASQNHYKNSINLLSLLIFQKRSQSLNGTKPKPHVHSSCGIPRAYSMWRETLTVIAYVLLLPSKLFHNLSQALQISLKCSLENVSDESKWKGVGKIFSSCPFHIGRTCHHERTT